MNMDFISIVKVGLETWFLWNFTQK